MRRLLALNPRTFIASTTAVSVGALTAYYVVGEFSVVNFLLTLIGIVLAQGGVNLINDYYDYLSGADIEYRRLGGGHRYNPIVDFGMSPRVVLRVGYAMLASAVAVGTYLGITTSPLLVMILIALGLVMGIGYSAAPLRFRYRGLGELIGALSLGPLTSLGSYIVQAGSPSIAPVLNSVPNSCFAFLALLASGLLHYETDRVVGKRTLVVIMGPGAAEKLGTVVLAIGYASLVPPVVLDYMPPLVLAFLITLPLALRSRGASAWRSSLDMRLVLLATMVIAVALH
jgi:1,4-dihydroxy-2-naphthoate octaprenyltransferase